jgi:hypothetical protein
MLAFYLLITTAAVLVVAGIVRTWWRNTAKLPTRFPLIWIGYFILLCASTVYLMHTSFVAV